jgi:transposase
MPANNVPPEDAEALLRRNLGFSRILERPRTIPPHPNRAGSRGYPVYFREEQLVLAAAGLPTTVSASSIRRWQERLIPHRQTGNRENSILRGLHQTLLSTYVFAYPEATLDEIATFIANSSDGTIYSRQAISTRLKQLGLSRKRSSTEANQASLPRNKLIREMFWTMPSPNGVFGTPRHALIDVDEAGFTLEKVNRRYGRAFSGVRVSYPGNYGRGTNVSVFLAVEPGHPELPAHVNGSIQNPRRWCRVSLIGASARTFNDFIASIVADIDNNPLPGIGAPGRVFLWDNLRAHKSPLLYQTVEGGRRHIIQPRPPYMPCDGPIEYVFCQLEGRLNKDISNIHNLADLMRAINTAVANLGGFDATFAHCKYPD